MVVKTIAANLWRGLSHGAVAAHNSRMLPSGSNWADEFFELIATGEIPIRKVGRKTLVAASDLRDWVERLPVVETRSAT